jgi:hypothetical protein
MLKSYQRENRKNLTEDEKIEVDWSENIIMCSSVLGNSFCALNCNKNKENYIKWNKNNK